VLLLFLLPVVAYWAVDAWLESSGGRRMLERSLSSRAGMDVRLQGDFDLMLLPDIGVSGTELVISDPQAAGPLARSADYEISVALKPLFDGQVRIDWIRLTGGEIYPERYRSDASTGSEKPAGEVKIPPIDELTIRDFELVFSGQDNQDLRIDLFEVNGFADRQQAPFRLEMDRMAQVEGWMRFDAAASRLDLGSLLISRQGQNMTGKACLFIGNEVSVQLVLEADVIDLDLLRKDLPDAGMGTGDSDEQKPLDMRVQLSVGELKSGEVLAHGVVMNLGDDPDCGLIDDPSGAAR